MSTGRIKCRTNSHQCRPAPIWKPLISSTHSSPRPPEISNTFSVRMVRPPQFFNSPDFGGQFETNAISGSGAWITNTTGDPNLDEALNPVLRRRNEQYRYPEKFDYLANNIPYSAFPLDNRAGRYRMSLVDFANAGDMNDVSSCFCHEGNNASMTGITAPQHRGHSILGGSFDRRQWATSARACARAR